MTRHRLLGRFANGNILLAEGELVTVVEAEAGPGMGPSQPIQAGPHHLMVKTRHGRRVRLPLALLSPDPVPFQCPLCPHPPSASHREHVTHLIDRHLRLHLLGGLDLTRGQPACPFPSCHALAWPLVDALLYHYASHHSVLEKVLMYEAELAATHLRAELQVREDILDGLVTENVALKTRFKTRLENLSSSREVQIWQAREGGGGTCRCKELEAEVAELHRQLEEAREEQADTPTNSPKVSSSNDIVVSLSNVRSYEDQLEQEIQEVARCIEFSKIEVADHDEAKEKEKEWMKRREELEQEVAAAQCTSRGVTEENAVLRAREARTSADLARFEGSLAELAAEKAGLEQEHRRLQEAVEAKEEQDKVERERLLEEVRRVKAEVKVSRIAKEEVESKLAREVVVGRQVVAARDTAQAACRATSTENTAAAAAIRRINIQIKSQVKETSLTTGDLASTRLARKEAKVLKLKQEQLATLAKVQVEKDTAQKQVVKLREELGKVKEAKRRTGDDYASKSTDLSGELASSKERVEFYISQCSEFETQGTRWREEVQVLRRVVEEVTREKEEREEELRASQAKVEKPGAEREGQGLLEEMARREEALDAELRRKDWEIANYQRTLESALRLGLGPAGTYTGQEAGGQALDLRLVPREEAMVKVEDRPAGTKRRHGDSASSQGEQPPEEREPSSPSAADTSWSSTSTSPLGAQPPLKVIIKEEPFD